jgi:ABC-2 type transport system ATP-binding protein
MRELGQVKDLLQVKDITQVQSKSLSEAQIVELRQFLARMGVADATVTHPTTTLEELFMRVVGESAGSGQSRPRQDGAPGAGNGLQGGSSASRPSDTQGAGV